MRDMGTEVGGILGFTTLRFLDIKVDYRDGLRVDGLPRTPVSGTLATGLDPKWPCQVNRRRRCRKYWINLNSIRPSAVRNPARRLCGMVITNRDPRSGNESGVSSP